MDDQEARFAEIIRLSAVYAFDQPFGDPFAGGAQR